ncbi:molybdate ABC transporter substrate-binding protein [Pseudomonas sp. RIT-PI-q]|uniref:molybdate ABC transporter substrate-binding protein n=1 Tax=Pseudomonas sp. RIT-PI-q TaxID=1690247 RepID=UPI0006CC678C|nr:molybdate ABC transporter substrate-binding protein [Pseudomonas sp. RIT-PI-q]KPG95989.1 molybdate ABC transporter substrate-binding protein [Pseudomonas sp. RIT-PI-q]
MYFSRLQFASIRVAGALVLAVVLPSAHAGELVVSAASSLTNGFKSLATAYEARHPETKIILNFGAADVLVQQVIQGAPADVIASADQVAMDKAVTEKVVQPNTRQDFAANQMVLIVPIDSKLPIVSLSDLVDASVKRVAYGNPASVPLGRYAKAALEAAGQWDAVSKKAVFAQNVRQTLDYVARGEVDAGFVFASDAALMPDKVRIALRVASQTPITFPLAITTSSKQPAEAARFTAYVLSPEGQVILAKNGFLKP